MRKKRVTTEEAVDKLKSKFGDIYDYSNVSYIDYYTKIEIVCKKHGPFSKTLYNMMRSDGCPECAKEENASGFKMSQEEFIRKSIEKHGNVYSYDDVEYINSKTPVTITCKLHGKFRQKPQVHYLLGCGCPRCGGERAVKDKKHTKDGFVSKLRSIHGDKYDYSKMEYTNIDSLITIRCKLHGDHTLNANNHLRGAGCPHCANEINRLSKNFLYTRPAYLYYIKFYNDEETYYKIGVTSKSPELRARSICNGYSFKVLKSIPYSLGNGAFYKERSVLVRNKDYLTTKSPLKNGNTEVFDKDVMGWDNG